MMALDLGSTSARTVLVDPDGRIVAEARNSTVPLFPRPGWVELDPVALWEAQLDSIRGAMAQVDAAAADIAAVGSPPTGRRRSRGTGGPAARPQRRDVDVEADRPHRAAMERRGLDPQVRSRTGLNNDCTSTPKLAWFMENVEGFAERARR